MTPTASRCDQTASHSVDGGAGRGTRSSNDIKRSWDRVATTARQNLCRNWQNGRLWWNDPDAVVLTGELSDDEFRFHATAIYATGGMVLSGDDLTKISPDRLAMLRKFLPPIGRAAVFEDDSLRVGVIKLPNALMVCLFNWEDSPQTLSFRLPGPGQITDYWSGEALGRREGVITIKEMPPRSARLLVCKASPFIPAAHPQSALQRIKLSRKCLITSLGKLKIV